MTPAGAETAFGPAELPVPPLFASCGNGGHRHVTRPARKDQSQSRDATGRNEARELRRHRGSVRGSKRNDDVGRLRLMRFEPGPTGIAPAGNVHYHRRLAFRLGILGRLDDVQPVAGEEEGMLSKQLVQSRNDRMIVGNSLGVELAQSSFDLFGCQLHHHTPFLLATGAATVAGASNIRSARAPHVARDGAPSTDSWRTSSARTAITQVAPATMRGA